jgi:hypothetical protein
MRGNLYKIDSEYRLDVGGIPYATTDNSPYKRLSKQNCDEIFGVIDVEEIADRHTFGQRNHEWKAYIAGFNKNAELNKDKVFTLEDVLDAWELGASEGLPLTKAKKEKLLKSIQPTEIEVEIEMQCLDTTCDGINRKGICIPGDKPKLDSEGNLILKKI